MIGMKIDSDAIEEWRRYWTFEIVEGRRNKPKVRITVDGVDKELSPKLRGQAIKASND